MDTKLSTSVLKAGNCLLASGLAMALAMLATPAQAATARIHWNPTVTNDTGQQASDVHVEFVSNYPITVTRTYEAPGTGPAFGMATVKQNYPYHVIISYSGAVINPNQTTHIGADFSINTGSGMAPYILRSYHMWWTNPDRIYVASRGLPSMFCIGDPTTGSWFGGKSKWYTDAGAGTLIGTQWLQCQGSGISMTSLNWSDWWNDWRPFNHQAGDNMFVQTATVQGTAEMQLEDLNPNTAYDLSFPALGSVAQVNPPAPYPLPATGSMWIGLLAVTLGASAIFVMRRRSLNIV